MTTPQSEQCAFCKQPAEYYCDFVLGMECGGWSRCDGELAVKVNRFDEFVPGKGLPYIKQGGGFFTCDAPLCEACRKQVGHLSLTGDGVCQMESIDHCPLHADVKEKSRPMTAEDAERLRMAWKRRSMIRLAPI